MVGPGVTNVNADVSSTDRGCANGSQVMSGPIPDVGRAAHELAPIGVRGTFSP